jgi:hypothetical protein
MKRITLSIPIGFLAAWYLTGLLHHAITGRSYLQSGTEALLWLGGTWIVASGLAWVIGCLWMFGN